MEELSAYVRWLLGVSIFGVWLSRLTHSDSKLHGHIYTYRPRRAPCSIFKINTMTNMPGLGLTFQGQAMKKGCKRKLIFDFLSFINGSHKLTVSRFQDTAYLKFLYF